MIRFRVNNSPEREVEKPLVLRIGMGLNFGAEEVIEL
jgi:hypothetical protein